MKELKALERIAKLNADNFELLSQVRTKDILAIAEAFLALEQRAEAGEAKLGELEKQEPMGRVDRGPVSDSNEYPDARVVCLHEHVDWEAFQDGTELFLRPAPAINLAELVPDESSLADRHIEWLNTLQRPMFSDDDWEELTLYTWLAFRDSYRIYRAAILRNIEEAK